MGKLRDSRVAFETAASEANDWYSYTRSWSSFSGAWSRTMVVVQAGVVTGRSHEQGDEPDGEITLAWTEGPADLGTHPEGSRP